MLKAARWTIVGLLAVSVLILTFAIGYVVRGDGGGSSSASASANGGSADASDDFSNLNQIMQILQSKYVEPNRLDTRFALPGGDQRHAADAFRQRRVLCRPEHREDDASAPPAASTASAPRSHPRASRSSSSRRSPAARPRRRGSRPATSIEAVDGESTDGWTEEKAVLKIRGPRGTKVQLKVKHADGREETFNIERDAIKVASVNTQPPGGVLKDGAGNTITDIGYIQIREFSETTDDEMQKALKDVVSQRQEGADPGPAE